MGGKAIDIAGKEYGWLTAIEPTSKRSKCGAVFWRCKCRCGKEIEVIGTDLRNGHAKSCGCYTNSASLLKNTRARPDNQTGVRGVQKQGDYYRAQLTFQGIQHRINSFTSIEEALKARQKMYDEIVAPYLEEIERQ